MRVASASPLPALYTSTQVDPPATADVVRYPTCYFRGWGCHTSIMVMPVAISCLPRHVAVCLSHIAAYRAVLCCAVFVQARQLPLLAPVLPVKDPLLPSQAYDLVLQVSSRTVHQATQCCTMQYRAMCNTLFAPVLRVWDPAPLYPSQAPSTVVLSCLA
jgi:hypothetical protein